MAKTEAMRELLLREEILIRRLLSQWESELVPTVIRRAGDLVILGLGVEDDPTGRVIVPAKI